MGLAGVEGNGQREFIRALAGLEAVHGEMTVGSRKVQMGDPIAVREVWYGLSSRRSSRRGFVSSAFSAGEHGGACASLAFPLGVHFDEPRDRGLLRIRFVRSR